MRFDITCPNSRSDLVVDTGFESGSRMNVPNDYISLPHYAEARFIRPQIELQTLYL